MILAIIAGCSDYASDAGLYPLDDCGVVGSYIACPGPLEFDEAEVACWDLDAELVDLTGDTTADPVVDAGLSVTDGQWWVGWPSTYTCPAMDASGFIDEALCLEPLAYVCEL